MNNPPVLGLAEFSPRADERSQDEILDAVFFALSHPIRWAILAQLGEEALLVS